MDNFQNKINEIKNKANIVSIIGQYVKLEKHGSDFIGLCPFHEDKNPSLSVSPTKNIFKCFSCNVGGNAITFIQKYKKIPFMEALREVANTVNISLPITQKEAMELRKALPNAYVAPRTTHKKYYAVESKEVLKFLKKYRNGGESK